MRTAITLALLIFATLIQAASITDRLQQLVDQGKMLEAFQLALPQLDEQAGNPTFDLLFGIAAIEVGQVNEGIFALERVVFVEPDNHRARLEYGRGLYILGQDALARQAFNHVLDNADPPASVVTKIEQFLDAIRRRESRYQTTASGYVGLTAGYDSNINSAPGSQITLIQLNQESLGKGDNFSNLIFGGQVFYPVSKNRKIYGRWDSVVRGYEDEHEQDHSNHSLTIGHQWNQQQHQFDLSFNAQRYILDDSSYRTLYGPTLSWTKALSKELTMQLGGSWLTLDHPDIGNRDSRQLLFNARIFGELESNQSGYWFVGSFYGDERSDDQSIVSLGSVDRTFIGFQGGGQITLSQDLSLITTATIQNSSYESDDWLYGITRDDTYTALDLELKQLLDANWQLSANLNLSRNQSNIELYEYHRRQLSLSVRYEF
ncbi:MAG: surface lipoprotein assembly modifier [Motiliproteus sp.]